MNLIPTQFGFLQMFQSIHGDIHIFFAIEYDKKGKLITLDVKEVKLQ